MLKRPKVPLTKKGNVNSMCKRTLRLRNADSCSPVFSGNLRGPMRSVGTPWPASGWRTTPTRSCGATTSTTVETSASSPSTTEWYVTFNVELHLHWAENIAYLMLEGAFGRNFSDVAFLQRKYTPPKEVKCGLHIAQEKDQKTFSRSQSLYVNITLSEVKFDDTPWVTRDTFLR